MDLTEYTKDQIRNSPALADEFNAQFKEKFGRDAKFCCSFSDYDKMFNFNSVTVKTKNAIYKVDYKPDTILSFKKNNRVTRSKAKDANDQFLEDFLKLRNKKKFPDAEKRVVKIEKKASKKPKAKKTTAKADKPVKPVEKEQDQKADTAK